MPLIACHECDLLQQECTVPPGGKAQCARCGALLYRNVPDSMNRSLALTVTAAIAFTVANVYPFVTISAAGRVVQATIFGSVLEMWKQGMILVAPMVFLNAIAFPGASILATGYVLLRVRHGGRPGHLIEVLRLLQLFKPWGMTEVFLLGLIVSVVKLGAYARVAPEVALWAIGSMVLLTAAIATVFDPRIVWIWIDEERHRQRSALGRSSAASPEKAQP